MRNPVPELLSPETEWLAAVERERDAVSPALTAMLPADRPATVAQVQAAIAFTHQVEAWYLHLRGPAQALNLGRVTQRLDEVLAEIRTSRGTCEAMLLKRIAAQQAVFDSQPPPAPPPDPVAAHKDALAQQMAAWEQVRKERQAQFDAWAEQHRKQQAEFDARNQLWEENFKKH